METIFEQLKVICSAYESDTHAADPPNGDSRVNMLHGRGCSCAFLRRIKQDLIVLHRDQADRLDIVLL